MIAVVLIVAFLVVCALAPRYGVDSRFSGRPGRQLQPAPGQSGFVMEISHISICADSPCNAQ